MLPGSVEPRANMKVILRHAPLVSSFEVVPPWRTSRSMGAARTDAASSAREAKVYMLAGNDGWNECSAKYREIAGKGW